MTDMIDPSAAPLHVPTPLIACRGLDEPGIGRIDLKMECYQPTGSFKIRGIGLLCQRHKAAGAGALVSSSGGNAGYAAAFAGLKLGIPVTVVVPSTTSATAVRRLEELQAEVIVEGDAWDDADRLAQSLVTKGSAGYVPPFNHPMIWEGHSTLVDELAAQGPRPDAIIVAIGGGGLMCGVAEGLERNGWHDVPLITVGTEGADAFDRSVRAGHAITLPGISSIAKSLGARRVADAALEWTARRSIISVVVSDQSALRACYRFADEHQTLVEPACGAALSLAYDRHEALLRYGRVVIVVCGGIGVTFDRLNSWGGEQLPLMLPVHADLKDGAIF